MNENDGRDALVSATDTSAQPPPFQETPQRLGGSDEPHYAGPSRCLMAADILEGDEILNREGETLGTLEQIMLDVPGGRIAYALVSTGGVLGIGEKLVAIPWGALLLDSDSECLILDISKEEFARAPEFDEDDALGMADDTWAREVHSFYRARPYYWA